MRKFIIGLVVTASLLLSGCGRSTTESQTASEAAPIKKETSANTVESSQEKFTNMDYYKEHKEWIDPQMDLIPLLRAYSWYNSSFILTFNEDGTIDAYSYPGSKEKLYRISYGSYFMNGKNSLHLTLLSLPEEGAEFVATIEERKIVLSQIDADQTGMNLWAMERFTETPTEEK